MPALKASFNNFYNVLLVSFLQELVKLFAVFLHILVKSCSSIGCKDLLSLLMNMNLAPYNPSSCIFKKPSNCIFKIKVALLQLYLKAELLQY